MKRLKRLYKIFVLLLVFTFIAPVSLPISPAAIAQAATVKLNKKTLTLEVGKTAALKISGTKQKVTWASSKKSVATVSSKGVVSAIKAGTATITATVNKKKYTCTVIVNAPVNPDVANAPFDAQEAVFNNINIIFPKDWTSMKIAEQGTVLMETLYPASADINTGISNITFTIQETDVLQPEYSLVKEILAATITPDFIKSQLANSGIDAELSDFKTSDFVTKSGTAFKTEYVAATANESFTQKIYDLYIDNYFLEVTVNDIGDAVTPDINTIAEYILDTVKEAK